MAPSEPQESSSATSEETWFVVKTEAGTCEIASCLPSTADSYGSHNKILHWGPYSSRGEAIARRVGLIRAGKCAPM
ncbi:MAG: hypothetical protein ACFB0C_15765 [Leptolyngbyaceae cyanobacterium]